MRDARGLIVIGTEYRNIGSILRRFDSDKPLRFLVFEVEGGGLAVEFFDQSDSEKLDELAAQFCALNGGARIYVQSREEWLAFCARVGLSY